MAEVLLFHHVQGRTDGVLAFADDLRASGHIVHCPDLFGGNVFATVDDGISWAVETGFGVLIERGLDHAAAFPASLVYAGFSFGVLPAQRLAQTRAGARGALFFESCSPVDEFGDGWPEGLAVQVHGMDADPFFAAEGDIDAARALVEEAGATARAELFVYPGDQHLFADRSLPSYDSEAAQLLMSRVLDFLEALDEV